jgi:hypothetical protein
MMHRNGIFAERRQAVFEHPKSSYSARQIVGGFAIQLLIGGIPQVLRLIHSTVTERVAGGDGPWEPPAA